MWRGTGARYPLENPRGTNSKQTPDKPETVKETIKLLLSKNLKNADQTTLVKHIISFLNNLDTITVYAP